MIEVLFFIIIIYKINFLKKKIFFWNFDFEYAISCWFTFFELITKNWRNNYFFLAQPLFCSEKSEFYFGMLYVHFDSILKRVERPKVIVT